MKPTIPDYVLALFDDGAGDGAGAGDGGGTGDTGAGKGGGVAVKDKPSKGGSSNGSSNGTGSADHQEPITDDDGRVFATASEKRIYDALQKQRGDTARARSEANQAKTRLDEIQPKAEMVDVMVQRAVRLESRDALRDAGALHPDIVDLFLTKSPTVKIDAKTGDVVGITEALEAFKKSHASLFKTATDDKGDEGKGDGGGDAGGDAAAKAALKKIEDDVKAAVKKIEDDAAAAKARLSKGNATSTGGSATGGGNSDTTGTGGLPDLRTLDPKQRRAALAAYKNSLR